MASKRTKGSTKTSVKKAKHASSVESTECVNSQEKLLAIGLDLSDYCPLCSKNDRVCLVSSHRVSDTDSRPREGVLSPEYFFQKLEKLTSSMRKPRESLGMVFDKNNDYRLNTIGSTFPFLNREESSETICKIFLRQDSFRQKAEEAFNMPAKTVDEEDRKKTAEYNSSFEVNKREVPIPLCMGLSGSGKSCAARRAVVTYLDSVEANSPELEAGEREFLEKLSTARDKSNFQLILDSLTSRNLSAVHKIVIELLAEACKYCGKLRETIASLFEETGCKVTLSMAYDWVVQQTGAKCLIVNLDEAQSMLANDLASIIRAFGEVLFSGRSVYYSVTGLYSAGTVDGVRYSFNRENPIYLPVLTVEQLCIICKHIGLLPQVIQDKQVNPHFRHLLWMTGGVPRYLDYLVYSIADECGEVHEKQYSGDAVCTTLREYVSQLTHLQFQCILSKWLSLCHVNLKNQEASTGVLDKIVSLTVAELPVLTHSSSNIGENYTFQQARQDQLFQLDGEGRMFVPPVRLLAMYQRSTSINSVRLIVLSNNMAGEMSSRDNESLYIAVVLRRIRAWQALGFKEVRLSALLRIAIDAASDHLIDVSSPGTYNYHRATSESTAESFTSKKSNEGSVSPPTSSFADAYLSLTASTTKQEIHIFIQEKQCTIARRKGLFLKQLPRVIHLKEVVEEWVKVPKRGIFVYLSDCEWATKDAKKMNELPENTYVVTGSKRKVVFGEFVGHLKSYCVSPSLADTLNE